MKLLADLISFENISRYECDGIIVSDADFSCFPERTFTYEETERIAGYCQEKNLLCVLNIDRIIEEGELSFLFAKLDKYLRLGIDYYIFSDYSVFYYFRKKGEEKRLIYDPKTLITNYEDAVFYKNLGIKVSISNELSLEEILAVSEAGNCVFEIYGHHQIFYSRRPLLTNYCKYSGLQLKPENTLFHLQEETRTDKYPIFQSKHGTFVYTPYRYALFTELTNLKEKLIFGRINTAFISEEEALHIISLYKEALAGDDMKIKFLSERLKEINPNIARGFLDKKSILFKEEA